VSKFRARTKPQDLLGIRQQTEADVQMSCKLANGVIYTLLKPGMAQGSCPRCAGLSPMSTLSTEHLAE
jgi:hypothetical protein